MVGLGTGGTSPLECNQRVKVWNNTNQLGDNGTGFISPPDFGSPPWSANGGNNLALWFAHHAAEHSYVNLVVVAKGGVPISSWEDGQPVYQEIIDVYSLTAQPPADIFLWHQGESDWFRSTKEEYKTKFLDLISRLKADGILAERATVIVGELRDERAGHINEALVELANENDDIFFVSSEGLDDYDGVHYTGEALCEFGLRYYEAGAFS